MSSECIFRILARCHQAIYQRDPIEEVIPGLWIGDMTSGPYYPYFNCIIDCTEDLDIGFLYGRAPNYRLGLCDIHNPDFREYCRAQHHMLLALRKITPVIDQRLKKGDNVLVHCRAGKQRSATIIASYLIQYRGETVANAIKIVQSRARGSFKPFCNFKFSLRKVSQIK